MKFIYTLALLLAFTPFARASDKIINLPEGQVELTDIMSPEEIYSDMLGQGTAGEYDFSDLDADATDARDATNYRVYIYVSKAQQHLWVYVDGRVWADWAVSTGTEQLRCPPAPASCRIASTPTGRRNPGALDWEHYSSLYGNAPMHRATQFVGGIYLHATYGSHIRMLGRRDSGGCVRQHPDNAERLFLLVKDVVSQYGRKAVLIEITER